jgi:hypothetical protein
MARQNGERARFHVTFFLLFTSKHVAHYEVNHQSSFALSVRLLQTCKHEEIKLVLLTAEIAMNNMRTCWYKVRGSLVGH